MVNGISRIINTAMSRGTRILRNDRGNRAAEHNNSNHIKQWGKSIILLGLSLGFNQLSHWMFVSNGEERTQFEHLYDQSSLDQLRILPVRSCVKDVVLGAAATATLGTTLPLYASLISCISLTKAESQIDLKQIGQTLTINTGNNQTISWHDWIFHERYHTGVFGDVFQHNIPLSPVFKHSSDASNIKGAVVDEGNGYTALITTQDHSNPEEIIIQGQFQDTIVAKPPVTSEPMQINRLPVNIWSKPCVSTLDMSQVFVTWVRNGTSVSNQTEHTVAYNFWIPASQIVEKLAFPSSKLLVNPTLSFPIGYQSWYINWEMRTAEIQGGIREKFAGCFSPQGPCSDIVEIGTPGSMVRDPWTVTMKDNVKMTFRSNGQIEFRDASDTLLSGDFRFSDSTDINVRVDDLMIRKISDTQLWVMWHEEDTPFLNMKYYNLDITESSSSVVSGAGSSSSSEAAESSSQAEIPDPVIAPITPYIQAESANGRFIYAVSNALAVDTNTIYFGDKLGLRMMDDLSKTVIQNLEFPETLSNLFRQGDKLFAVMGKKALYRMQIHNASTLEVLNKWSCEGKTVKRIIEQDGFTLILYVDGEGFSYSYSMYKYDNDDRPLKQIDLSGFFVGVYDMAFTHNKLFLVERASAWETATFQGDKLIKDEPYVANSCTVGNVQYIKSNDDYVYFISTPTLDELTKPGPGRESTWGNVCITNEYIVSSDYSQMVINVPYPLDAELVGNKMYILHKDGARSCYAIQLYDINSHTHTVTHYGTITLDAQPARKLSVSDNMIYVQYDTGVLSVAKTPYDPLKCRVFSTADTLTLKNASGVIDSTSLHFRSLYSFTPPSPSELEACQDQDASSYAGSSDSTQSGSKLLSSSSTSGKQPIQYDSESSSGNKDWIYLLGAIGGGSGLLFVLGGLGTLMFLLRHRIKLPFRTGHHPDQSQDYKRLEEEGDVGHVVRELKIIADGEGLVEYGPSGDTLNLGDGGEELGGAAEAEPDNI